MTRSVRKPGAFFDCFLQICRQLSFVACGMDSFRGFLFFFLPHSLLSILPCIAAVARRRRQVACPANCVFFFLRFLSFFFFFYPEWRLLPGAGGRSPARRGAWGERGGCPSTPPAPPYSPLGGNAESVFFIGLYPVRRVSRGRRREPSRPFRPGDVRACCGAPSALRAHGIAFAPAPSLHQRWGRRAEPCRK